MSNIVCTVLKLMFIGGKMEQQTFQMALAATARIACCATLLGLGACRDGATDKQELDTDSEGVMDTGEAEQEDTEDIESTDVVEPKTPQIPIVLRM